MAAEPSRHPEDTTADLDCTQSPFSTLLPRINSGEISAEEAARALLSTDSLRGLRTRRQQADPWPEECANCGAPGQDRDPRCEAGWLPAAENPNLYSRCPKASAAEKASRLRQAQRRAAISERHRRAAFENFEPADGSAAEACEAAQNYLRAFAERRAEGEGLCLYGPPGTGKTHLAYAVLNSLIALGEPVLAVPATELLRSVKQTYTSEPQNKAKAEDHLERITGAATLLLEDLGTARPSEWLEEQIHELIDHRYRRLLPTLITTNHSPDGALAARIGEAAESRIIEMCDLYHVAGPDQRRSRPAANR